MLIYKISQDLISLPFYHELWGELQLYAKDNYKILKNILIKFIRNENNLTSPNDHFIIEKSDFNIEKYFDINEIKYYCYTQH